MIQEINAQYARHGAWTILLHHANLVALSDEQRELGVHPSYATVRRYFRTHGLHRKRQPKRQTPGALAAVERLKKRQVRSYEIAHVPGLWHTDCYHGSRRVLLLDGTWITPLLLSVIDDHSRVICHMQRFCDETAESFVHAAMIPANPTPLEFSKLDF